MEKRLRDDKEAIKREREKLDDYKKKLDDYKKKLQEQAAKVPPKQQIHSKTPIRSKRPS